jgi:hypothetical protein
MLCRVIWTGRLRSGIVLRDVEHSAALPVD